MSTSEAVEFPLPDGWRLMPPAGLNLDSEFLAIKVDTNGSGFTASVVFDGTIMPPGSSLTGLADAALVAQPTGTMLNRTASAGPHGQRLRQTLRLESGAAKDPQRLVRVEEYRTLADRATGAGMPVMRAVSTATPDQANEVAHGFDLMLAALDAHLLRDGQLDAQSDKHAGQVRP